MEYYFGYNCKHYIPTLTRCRILIDKYRQRKDLVEKKWFNVQDILTYLNLTTDELVKQVASGEIEAKRQKDGKLKFQVLSAWQWDDCHSSNAGGQCFYFEPHDGEKISYLAELRSINTANHPNIPTPLTEDELRMLENKVTQLIGGNLKHA